MPYNIENLSLKSLEKIYLVLDDIKFNMEIQNKTKYLDMGEFKGIEGVPKSEHQNIMNTLLNDTDLIDNVHRNGDDFGLDMNVEKFNKFLKKVADKINELKSEKTDKKITPDKKLSFDKIESVLSIDGHKIKIAIRDKKPIAHDILEYIFIDKKDNIADDFFYAEIAFDKFGDEKYTKNPIAWRKYHAACMDIQDKIRKQATGKIDDFLDYNASKRGRVKINPKYLK